MRSRSARGSADSPAVTPAAVTPLIDRRLEERLAVGQAFFASEAERIALTCRTMSDRFAAGGRLLATGRSPQARSDAQHVAVEFTHPVIVGKRALPALYVEGDAGVLERPGDILVEFEPDGGVVIDGEPFAPATDDPFTRQEIVETLYHVLWELVHVFFEHRAGAAGGAGTGASTFLYPFLAAPGEGDDDAVMDDVRRSVIMKAEEIGALRATTAREHAGALAGGAAALRDAGVVLALGNGGSATDAMDAVADLRTPPAPPPGRGVAWRSRAAIDLAADSSILTAVANDVGVESIFSRQVIAYGEAGDVVVAFSTSGGSANVIAALAEARRRGLATIAFVGYDGGRIASERLADHVVVSASQNIPRIQEAQATAWHLMRELVEAEPTGADS